MSKIKCEQCNVPFSRKRELRRHTMTAQAHSTTREHECNLCYSAFARKDTLKRHKNSKKCDKARQQRKKQQQQQQQQQDQQQDQQLQKIGCPLPEREQGVLRAYIDNVYGTQNYLYRQVGEGMGFCQDLSLPYEWTISTTGFGYDMNVRGDIDPQPEEEHCPYNVIGLYL